MCERPTTWSQTPDANSDHTRHRYTSYWLHHVGIPLSSPNLLAALSHHLFSTSVDKYDADVDSREIVIFIKWNIQLQKNLHCFVFCFRYWAQPSGRVHGTAVAKYPPLLCWLVHVPLKEASCLYSLYLLTVWCFSADRVGDFHALDER